MAILPALLLSCLLQATPPVPVLAQDKDVVITASRVEEERRHVASSNTVIDETDLDRAQRRFVLDALREVPALDVVRTGSLGSTTSVFIRGANSEHTLVLIDGIEVHDAASTGRAFDFAHLSADHIGRIEVIRGPQSVLYGSDAIGGVIQLISPLGSGPPRFTLGAEAGSFATYRGHFSASGGSDLVRYSIAGSRLQTAGISSASDRFPENSERDGYRNSTLGTRVAVTPSDWFQLDLVARYADARAELDNNAGAFGDDPNHLSETRNIAFKVEPRVKLFDGRWEQALAVKLSQTERDTDNLPDDMNPQMQFSSFDSRIVDLDWQHNFRLHETNLLTFGAEFEEDTMSSSFYSDQFGPFFTEIRKRTAWTRGAYVQDRIQIGEIFTATAGARIDTHERFGTYGTWRLTGAFTVPCSGTRLRGTVGTGFKAPSLFQLHSSFGNPDLDPEESLGWDVGVDQGLWNDAVVLGATYFRNEFENLINFDLGTNLYGNIGRADSEGGEFTARIRPFDSLEIQLSYTVTVTEDKSTGESLLRRPRHKGGARVTWFMDKTFSATLGAMHIGDREDLDFSTFPSTRVTLDHYWLGHLAVSYRPVPEFEIFGRIENLFDQDYEEALGFGTPGAAGYLGGALHF
jgi:vitamin B12 transporter